LVLVLPEQGLNQVSRLTQHVLVLSLGLSNGAQTLRHLSHGLGDLSKPLRAQPGEIITPPTARCALVRSKPPLAPPAPPCLGRNTQEAFSLLKADHLAGHVKNLH